MASLTKEEFLEKIFKSDYSKLKGKTLRMTRRRVPGKQVNMAQIITPSDESIYKNLGLHIGVHAGCDFTGKSIGIISFTPWESVVVAADVAMKSGNVEIGFMDRFCGTLIVLGDYSEVESSVTAVVGFFDKELNFPVCRIHKS